MHRVRFVLASLLLVAWQEVWVSGDTAASAQIASPTAVPARIRPVRLRPTRPPRVRPVRPQHVEPTPTMTPTGTPSLPVSTPTRRPAAVDCEHACEYPVSQMRMLWYGGLSFTAVIKNGGCPPLTPEVGESGSVQIDRFLTAQRHDRGFKQWSTFVLGDNGIGQTSLNGTVQFSRIVDSYAFAYSAPVPAVANIRAGQEFPVELTVCLTLGDQAVKMHLVCQGKNQGMLCHEG